ncbi:hypothetical protein N566_08510 [Streptomycetaceae bacterium MP113-05]|nr:hypothetical protein N566_08510 [Streptomycetaceae bacterium MP113-05]
MTTADLHTLTGAYSIHALPEAEREEFERHLGACASCAQEVRELTATATKLGLASSLTPPPAMRERVFAEIANVRQEPPQVPRTHRRNGGSAAGRVRRLPKFALAASLAAAAALGGVTVWQYQIAQDARERAEQAEQRGATMAQLLAAPDAKVTVGGLPDGASGTVVVSRSEDRAAFFSAGMPEAPADKTYQLWFSDHGTMRPAGLMQGGGQADALVMEGPVGDASAMGITVEPAGGSEQPTTDPVALMELPA